jgi:hypothetical protein
MAQEGISYGITVDASQANAELAKVRTSVETLAGSETKLAKSGDGLQKSVGRLAENLSKQAAAVSLVSSSMQGMGGEIGKLIAGAGQMAAAFGAGGPYAAALVGGIALIDRFTKALDDKIKKEDEAREAEYKAINAIIDRRKALGEEVEALRRSIDPEIERQEVVAAAAAEIRKNQLLIESIEAKRASSLPGLRAEGEARANEAAQLRKTNILIAERISLQAQQRQARSAPSGGGRSTSAPRTVGSSFDADMDLMATDYAIKTREEALQHKRDTEEEATRIAQEQAEIRMQNAQMEWEHRLRLMDLEDQAQAEAQAKFEAYTQAQASTAMAAASTVAGLTQSLVADLVSGQEQALERFGLSVMAQAGQVLVGEGIKLVGLATTSMLTPGGQPLAVAQFAGSAALIGAGVGLGGTAQGLGGLLGGGAQSAPTSAPRLTTGGSGGGTSSGGGNTVVQITYAGASGPTADHAAVAATDALRRADRRRIRAVERV